MASKHMHVYLAVLVFMAVEISLYYNAPTWHVFCATI
jgi:hypothetical protein